MRRRLAEETILFVSVLKWVALATLTGAIVGVFTSFFIHTLAKTMNVSKNFSYAFFFLPIIFLFNQILLKNFAPKADGYETNRVIRAIHHREKISILSVLKAFVCPILTISFGGSAGKEAPSADIGAGTGSLLGQLFHFDEQDTRKLMICGVSAGFAAVFGTPIAGALFGAEVLFVGGLLYEVLLPSFIAGITSYHVSASLGVDSFYHPMYFVPQFSESFFLKVCLAGVFFGFCAFLLIEIYRFGKRISANLKINIYWKGVLGGAAMIILALIFSKDYLGLGLDQVERCFIGQGVAWFSPFIKMISTSITLNFGGAGGIVTPIFFIGATAGSVFANWLNLDQATMSAIGFVAVLAGAANTPIAASVMAIEIFGPKLAPYATVACVISFLMTGHRSVYDAQILFIKKSPSVDVSLGGDFSAVKARPKFREKSFINTIHKSFLFIKDKIKLLNKKQ